MKKLAPLFILSILLTACGSVKQVAPSKYNPKFGYTPEQRIQISENILIIAIIDPVFSDGRDITISVIKE